MGYSKPQPVLRVHVLIAKVDDDVLRRLSLCLADYLLDHGNADGERIYTTQMSIFVSVRSPDRDGNRLVEMTVCHKRRAAEIDNVVYRYDLRPKSSLFHIADFLETREWVAEFFKISAAIHG